MIHSFGTFKTNNDIGNWVHVFIMFVDITCITKDVTHLFSFWMQNIHIFISWCNHDKCLTIKYYSGNSEETTFDWSSFLDLLLFHNCLSDYQSMSFCNFENHCWYHQWCKCCFHQIMAIERYQVLELQAGVGSSSIVKNTVLDLVTVLPNNDMSASRSFSLLSSTTPANLCLGFNIALVILVLPILWNLLGRTVANFVLFRRMLWRKQPFISDRKCLLESNISTALFLYTIRYLPHENQKFLNFVRNYLAYTFYQFNQNKIDNWHIKQWMLHSY